MIEFVQERSPRVKAAGLQLRLQLGSLVSGGRSGGGFDRGKGVVVRGSFRKHRGSGSRPGAGGKMQAHFGYISGDLHKEADRERRQLHDDRGLEQTSAEALEKHQGCFIEHRIIISPSIHGGRVTDKDLHVLSQAVIQEARSRNPKAEIEASYAIHTDTDNPHSHIILTSLNRVKLGKKDYAYLREMTHDLRLELERERQQGREHSHALDSWRHAGQEREQGQENLER